MTHTNNSSRSARTGQMWADVQANAGCIPCNVSRYIKVKSIQSSQGTSPFLQFLSLKSPSFFILPLRVDSHHEATKQHCRGAFGAEVCAQKITSIRSELSCKSQNPVVEPLEEMSISQCRIDTLAAASSQNGWFSGIGLRPHSSQGLYTLDAAPERMRED